MLSNRTSRKISIFATVAAFVTANVAFAQGETPAAPPTTPPPAPGGSVHEQMVGRIGVGFLGTQQMFLGAITPTGTPGDEDDVSGNGLFTSENSVIAPVIGVRYWLDSFMGIDAGLGFALESSSVEATPGGSADGPSKTAFILHGGLPLALYSEGHFSFQLIPELNIGFATGSVNNGDNDTSGFHFDLGGRAGAEIDFGFIGIPRLALQGGVGVKLALDSVSTEYSGTNTELSASQMRFATSLNGNPWDIFTGNIAALYYF